MIVEVILSIFGVAIAYALYRQWESARYFEEKNIKYQNALRTILNILKTSLGGITGFEMSANIYNAFPSEPIYGSFDFSVRQYIVRDPEAYKRIAIKDFDYFQDHRVLFDENVSDLFANSLISLNGEKWRHMRATLSPAFTGSKMRQMFELVSECADELVMHFMKKAEGGEQVHIEMKDFFSRYTNDVIGTCAFGIKVNSYAEPENDFYMNGKQMMNFGGIIQSLKFMVLLIVPKFASFLKLKIFDVKITEAFKSMIVDTMEMREKNNIHRPDMINLMMKVRQGSLSHQTEEKSNEVEGFATVEESEVGKTAVSRKWSDNELVAQCLLFFVAGFETIATALSFAAYELVANQDIQQKLYEEISEMDEQLNGQRITYEVLQKMKYLDQVVSETLRKWPGAVQTDRSCVKDYVYDDGNGMKFTIEKGSNIIFPVYGIHRDPKHYPNPDKFDPERFSDENKHNIVAGSYAPFGVGPRNCIGSRFALMEMKAILYYLLRNFSFEVNDKTQIPLKMKKTLFLAFEKGVHLELKPRKKVTP